MTDVLVIGLGISGKSAAAFLKERGFTVFAHDDKQDVTTLGFAARDDRSMDTFEFVVVSPGVPKSHPLYKEALEKGIDVIGEVELACRHLNAPIIAVTGTNGKTTVTLLIEHVLKQCGKNVRLLGNGGVPMTAKGEDAEIIVIELSSFQLETLKAKVIDYAAILNVSPDHLDRYQGMEDYAAAKFHIHRCLKENGILFVQNKAFADFGHLLGGFPVKTYSAKTHDEENRLAAFFLCNQLGISEEEFLKAEKTFKKPPHRIEFVRKIRGIAYYNDSKGTNLDAVIRCVEVMKGPSVLIVGGVDKGFSFREWIAPFNQKVTALVAIGEASEKIQKELGGHFSICLSKSLEQAVEQASQLAKPGENVVLSPGCASFDMFKNFEHRGDVFKKIVMEIA